MNNAIPIIFDDMEAIEINFSSRLSVIRVSPNHETGYNLIGKRNAKSSN